MFDHGEAELKKFLDFLNTKHPTVKFTSEYSTKEVHFLDVTVHKTDIGELYTSLYIKPTDAYSYLYFSSCHPVHIKRSIPYSQAE